MQGFPPVAGDNALVLILGSFPSAESLRRGEYYAHQRNSFWRIMFSLFNEKYSPDYSVKRELLLHRGIGLWDVVFSHDGRGSADKDILNPVANNFPPFFAKHPDIRHIFFNGSTSETLFVKLADKTQMPENMRFTRLASTSPANARFSFETKLINWSSILAPLKNPPAAGC